MTEPPMKLGFEETQKPYLSGSQSARAWTERWVRDWVFCPSCGHKTLEQYPANKPVADFRCSDCSEQYELKSQQANFGAKIVDGAFRTMCERLASSENPNLFLLRYDRRHLSVRDMLVVPKHFFVRDLIEERKPLAPTARRAGWIGCNIVLSSIPASGKIYIVRNGAPLARDDVLTNWRRTLFLRDETVEARGWLIEVLRCVELLGRPEFTLSDVYAFEARLSKLYPGNRFVRPKIRQQLQVLRDNGVLAFVSPGVYRLRSG